MVLLLLLLVVMVVVVVSSLYTRVFDIYLRLKFPSKRTKQSIEEYGGEQRRRGGEEKSIFAILSSTRFIFLAYVHYLEQHTKEKQAHAKQRKQKQIHR